MTTREMLYDRVPQLVFWETTKACPLACRHCRANAISCGLPDQLTTQEGFDLIDQIASFGQPSPILILTGGDVLMREDLDELIVASKRRGLRVALAPAVSPLLSPQRAASLRSLGIRSVSISLDGVGAVHDRVRGVDGHFDQTVQAIDLLLEHGFVVQVNSTVMVDTVDELPKIVAFLLAKQLRIWEVFFVIEVGRGVSMLSLAPSENEDVANFLYDMSGYGLVVRTVEAPFFRRVVRRRQDGEVPEHGPLYQDLIANVQRRVGAPLHQNRVALGNTRDGKGIIFVAHNGDVYPSGFLPLTLGSVRNASLVSIYQDDALLRDIRAAQFTGSCGSCDYRDLCGGSRSRAFAAFGDPLASDPACGWVA
ncbi:MAG: TIGR04053 family radical SAM/SPASM domain-containing protein [Ferrimicrobium sp.]|uniref:TIGR04053 family radical SAM/SPASM domain-containing protein n=1 Tax=Ferrimicrobium acidiphilum TaxID=121039 RepID=A0ABV3Y5P5_9ACTN|nr:TIGR04053 family radical SAM/SPASM domain-containing protein [Ferrimicrobium sp.]MCL5973276.1 TIGR04053 family radical SAM/SPASM domain-containing protein [Actinomycetota bacterium]